MYSYRLKKIKLFPFLILCIIFSFVLFGCRSKEQHIPKRISLNTVMLDSIKRSADSIYAKEYFTRDFAEAIYFKNTKDTTLTQVMKDKDSIVRQVIITKNKKRLFYAQYYGNGQLIAKYNLDDFGQYDGYSEEYYQNGEVRSSGFYSNGFYIGKWKNTDSLGNYISTDEYNNDGRKIRSSVE